MEEPSTKGESELVDLVSNLNERLTTLEAKVTKLSSTHEQGKTRLEEIQEFSENIVTLQERKLAEVEENQREQKKLLGEMRVQLQTLQNSRVNHKDVLVRHENHTKKLIELVNDINERQLEFEIERGEMKEKKSRRFSSFEAKGRRTHTEDLYDFEDKRGSGSGKHHHHHHHRRTQSGERRDPGERRKSAGGGRRTSNDF